MSARRQFSKENCRKTVRFFTSSKTLCAKFSFTTMFPLTLRLLFYLCGEPLSFSETVDCEL